MQTCGSDGIELLQSAMQRFDTVVDRFGFQPLPNLIVRGRTGKDASQQTAQIQSGTTDEQRRPTTSDNVTTDRLRCGEILGDAEILRRLQQIEQVMGHSATLIRGRFRRANVHAAIQRHRIERHDFECLALQLFRECQRDAALSAGGGTGEKPTTAEKFGSESHAFQVAINGERLCRDNVPSLCAFDYAPTGNLFWEQ